MPAQESHVSIEELPNLIEQLSQLFNESCELRTQIKHLGDNFMDEEFMEIHNQHKDRLRVVDSELEGQFDIFITLHHLSRELLIPHEATLTDLVLRFTKLQELVRQG